MSGDDWRGDPLPPGASGRLGSARMRHTGPPLALRFLPGNRLLSTGAGATAARLWCASKGSLQALLPCGPFACVDAAARGDDQVVLALGRGEVGLWSVSQVSRLAEIDTGVERPQVLVGTDQQVLIFAPAGVTLWDPEKGTSETSEWSVAFEQAFTRLRAWSLHGQRIVLVGQGGVALCERRSGAVMRRELEPGCTWAEVRKKGEELLLLANDGTLWEYPPGTGPRREIARGLRVVAQTATGRLVGQYRGGGALVWLESGDHFGGHQDEVFQLVADGSAERVAFADQDHGLHVLEEQQPDPGRFGVRFPFLLGFLPKGQVVAGRSSQGVGAALFDLETTAPEDPGEKFPALTMAVAYRGESRPPGVLDAFGILSWGQQKMRVQRAPKRWGQLLAQGDVAVVRTQEREISGYSFATQKRIWSATTPANVNDFVTDPAGEFLILASNRRQLLFFLLRSGKSQGSLRLPTNPVQGLVFHPRGREFYALTGGRKLYRVDLMSRAFEVVAELPEPGSPRGLAISGCGRWLAVIAEPETVRVYPLRSQGLGAPRSLEGHAAPIAALAFSPQGVLVTTSHDGTALLWRL